MQIHRQTQIIITEVAAAVGKGSRLQPARFYYMGMYVAFLLAVSGRPQMNRRVTEYGRVTCLQIAPN